MKVWNLHRLKIARAMLNGFLPFEKITLLERRRLSRRSAIL